MWLQSCSSNSSHKLYVREKPVALLAMALWKGTIVNYVCARNSVEINRRVEFALKLVDLSMQWMILLIPVVELVCNQSSIYPTRTQATNGSDVSLTINSNTCMNNYSLCKLFLPKSLSGPWRRVESDQEGDRDICWHVRNRRKMWKIGTYLVCTLMKRLDHILDSEHATLLILLVI